MTIIQDLFNINKKLSGNLFHIGDTNHVDSSSPKLILPSKRDKTIRISEQESRVLYCNILNSDYSYYFSIETPTEKTYTFKGKKNVSALSDLSIYEKTNNNLVKTVNVEFKAHNVTNFSINKDIQKLVRERVIGNWFHTLKNADSGTLKSLFEKFRIAFKELDIDDFYLPVSIVFCFCVIDKKWACLKHFDFDPSKHDIETYVNKFFNLDYSPKNSYKTIVTTEHKNGWTIFEEEEYLRFFSVFHNKH